MQAIVDREFPQIVKERGLGKQGLPELELWVDIYARLSGEPEARGEESETSEAQYEEKTNIIYVYYPNMEDEEDVLRSLIHEYTHYLQVKDIEDREERSALFDKYKAMYDYDTDPTEIEAKKNEEDWHLFSQK